MSKSVNAVVTQPGSNYYCILCMTGYYVENGICV